MRKIIILTIVAITVSLFNSKAQTKVSYIQLKKDMDFLIDEALNNKFSNTIAKLTTEATDTAYKQYVAIRSVGGSTRQYVTVNGTEYSYVAQFGGQQQKLGEKIPISLINKYDALSEGLAQYFSNRSDFKRSSPQTANTIPAPQWNNGTIDIGLVIRKVNTETTVSYILELTIFFI